MSRWIRFSSIISKRDTFPRLEVVDVRPTYTLRLMDHGRLVRSFHVLKTPSGARLMLWGDEVRFILFPAIILILITATEIRQLVDHWLVELMRFYTVQRD